MSRCKGFVTPLRVILARVKRKVSCARQPGERERAKKALSTHACFWFPLHMEKEEVTVWSILGRVVELLNGREHL